MNIIKLWFVQRLVWTCIAKAHASLQKEMNAENEVEEHFGLGMDTRARQDSPVSSNYFRNTILGSITTLKTCQLVVM